MPVGMGKAAQQAAGVRPVAGNTHKAQGINNYTHSPGAQVNWVPHTPTTTQERTHNCPTLQIKLKNKGKVRHKVNERVPNNPAGNGRHKAIRHTQGKGGAGKATRSQNCWQQGNGNKWEGRRAEGKNTRTSTVPTSA